MKTNIKKNGHKKLVVTLSAIGLAVVLASVALLLTIAQRDSKPANEKSGTSEQSSNSPSSEEDEVDTDESKTTTPPNTDRPTEQSVDSTTGKTALQLVASADVGDDTVFLRGGINSIVDDNSTCVATLVGPGGKTITKETSLLQGATTTDCKTISIPIGELSTGTWAYTLSYNSDSATGKSDGVNFEIQ